MKLFGWTLITTVIATPALISFGLYKWFRLRSELAAWRSALGVLGSALALASWGLFVMGTFKGWIGGFGSHYVTSLQVSNAGLLLCAIAVFCTLFLSRLGRIFAIASSIITFLVWGGSQMVA